MKKQDELQLQDVVKILNKGGIGIIPTDTVFGIACRIDNEEGLIRLFSVKQRPEKQAVPVLVSDISMAEKYLEPIPEEVTENLINKYWPGALTVILPCKKNKVSSLIRGDGSTLGVRQPAYDPVLKLLSLLQVPITGTSANLHGKFSPVMMQDLDPELIKLVDFVLPGHCPIGRSSTVIDCSIHPWRIARKGSIEVSRYLLT